MRFETKPREQATVDWGTVTYRTPDGQERRLHASAMVLGWSRAVYLEFVGKADPEAFIRCRHGLLLASGSQVRTRLNHPDVQ